MVYRSKKDWWLFWLVWGAVSSLFVVGLYNVLGGDTQLGWELVRAGVVAAAVVVFTTYPLDYEITADELIARSGFMRWRVPLDSIEEVEPSRCAMSAPAWSLDRLEGPPSAAEIQEEPAPITARSADRRPPGLGPPQRGRREAP